MSTYRSEAAAWRAVAEYLESAAYQAEEADRPPALCFALGDFWEQGRLSNALYSRMMDRVREHKALGPNYLFFQTEPAPFLCSFAFPWGDRDSRVLAALLLALECDDKQRAAA